MRFIERTVTFGGVESPGEWLLFLEQQTSNYCGAPKFVDKRKNPTRRGRRLLRAIQSATGNGILTRRY